MEDVHVPKLRMAKIRKIVVSANVAIADDQRRINAINKILFGVFAHEDRIPDRGGRPALEVEDAEFVRIGAAVRMGLAAAVRAGGAGLLQNVLIRVINAGKPKGSRRSGHDGGGDGIASDQASHRDVQMDLPDRKHGENRRPNAKRNRPRRGKKLHLDNRLGAKSRDKRSRLPIQRNRL